MSALRFRAQHGTATSGTVIYRRSEYSFDFITDSQKAEDERIGDAGVTSVAIGTLQLELGVETGIIVHVWGLHPATRWSSGAVLPHSTHPGIVVVAFEDNDDAEEGFIPGVTVGLAGVGEWSTVFDDRSGWARVAADHDLADEQQVLIASGTVLGLVGDRLNSVWLHPEFQP